jgi:antigen flippase
MAVPQVTSASQGIAATGPTRHTYGRILTSSLLIGASSGFGIVIGVLRTKAMALLLGPAGLGLLGLYSSIITLAQAIAGMGINESGVRQIAEAEGSGNAARLARTVTVLRWASVALGIIGAIVLFVLCRPVAALTFGNYDNAYLVALLCLAVMLQTISNGQAALLQGLRRIGDIAKSAALGALFSAFVTILLIYQFREQGIVPSLVAIAGVSLLLSWWFTRNIAASNAPALSSPQIARETKDLLALGLAFLASNVLVMGAAYAVRLIIVRQIDVEAAGLYQSAWAIGGLYVGFILQAMSTDFYPRLAAVVTNHDECNRLVNEQTHVGMLLAAPGVLATLTFSPIVLSALYSNAFVPAVEILRWLCLGAALRVITWPIGFVIIAARKQTIFVLSEFVYTISYLAMAWAFMRHFGLNGAGLAFFVSYILHGIMVYSIVRRLTDFRWSVSNKRLAGLLSVLTLLVFSSFYILPSRLTTLVGTLTVSFAAIYSFHTIVRLLPSHYVARSIQHLLPVWARSPHSRTP